MPAFAGSVRQCLSHTALGQPETSGSVGSSEGQAVQSDAAAACAAHTHVAAETQRVACWSRVLNKREEELECHR